MKELTISLKINEAERIHAILEAILENRFLSNGSMFRESHVYNLDDESISAIENLLPVLKQEDVEDKSASPILKQFFELKSKHPGVILLFRYRDFYETYEEDAITCTEILGIVLTTRTDCNIKLAAFPFYALDKYLPKLIRSGKRVAICDPLENTKKK